MPQKYPAIPQKEITSVDVTGMAGGLFLNGAQNAPINAFIRSKDAELDLNGYLIPRRRLAKFLPDTVETTYQKAPILWENELYYFTLDDGKAKFAQEGDAAWTDCGPVPVAATLTTALTGSDNDLKFTAVTAGPDGNSITITYVDPGAPSAALSVSVVGTAITVNLATNGSSVITSTASLVLAAVAASTPASALVSVAIAPANTGAGVVTALASTPLAGGTGTNFFTTLNGGFPKFIRVLDKVLILNGKNGDKLAYIDLSSATFDVTKYSLVTDPSTAPTAALTSLTTGAFNIYYAFTYSGAVGTTNLSPILTQSINVTRDQWQTMGTPGSIKITRTGAIPAGATYWNLYIALASTGGTIQASDMLQVALKLDLATTDFVDDGTLDINLGGIAPESNSTDGPRVSNGIVEDGNPILFQDEDAPYNIWIGGGGPNALSFSVSDGGYRAEPEKGTNFYPNVIIGFRTGQGVPALTVLYSNTEGLSKQAVLQQQTVSYGNQSFTVWGVTEQHYGAAGVAAANSAINYNGKLLFLSTDGFMSMETQPSAVNVLNTKSISGPIDEYVRQIRNSAMPNVVGAAWNNKYMWLVPNAGFETPQQIMVLDTNNKGVNGDGAWYTLDIAANWIGVVSPQNDAAFVYISRENKTYKLLTGSSTYDTLDGSSVPFSTGATSGLIGISGNAHNTWQADVQVMFYVMGLIGEMTVGVTYRNQSGTLKTKTKVLQGPIFTPSGGGGWGDPQWVYGGAGGVPGWGGSPIIDDSAGTVQSIDIRKPIRIDDIFNEAQWFYQTDIGYNSYRIRAISFEGINLGVRPDLQ